MFAAGATVLDRALPFISNASSKFMVAARR
jgi:hypothetical protein